MSWGNRGVDIARELGMVLPRTVAGLNESTGWVPVSPLGVRQFGEVMLDELVLSGFSLLGGTPVAVRTPDACAAAAEELSPWASTVHMSSRSRCGCRQYSSVALASWPTSG